MKLLLLIVFWLGHRNQEYNKKHNITCEIVFVVEIVVVVARVG